MFRQVESPKAAKWNSVPAKLNRPFKGSKLSEFSKILESLCLLKHSVCGDGTH